jgi:hypothetical protein
MQKACSIVIHLCFCTAGACLLEVLLDELKLVDTLYFLVTIHCRTITNTHAPTASMALMLWLDWVT